MRIYVVDADIVDVMLMVEVVMVGKCADRLLFEPVIVAVDGIHGDGY
jgi:hypothetical protein